MSTFLDVLLWSDFIIGVKSLHQLVRKMQWFPIRMNWNITKSLRKYRKIWQRYRNFWFHERHKPEKIINGCFPKLHKIWSLFTIFYLLLLYLPPWRLRSIKKPITHIKGRKYFKISFGIQISFQRGQRVCLLRLKKLFVCACSAGNVDERSGYTI